jgi:hypothetical protein
MDGCSFATVPELSLRALTKDMVRRVSWNTVSGPGYLALGGHEPRYARRSDWLNCRQRHICCGDRALLCAIGLSAARDGVFVRGRVTGGQEVQRAQPLLNPF